eukprot:IDg23951t1
MDSDYIDRDIYGRGSDEIFGKGAELETKRQAALFLLRKRNAKGNIRLGEYIDHDVYGRGDPRIFGPNAHIANMKEAAERLAETRSLGSTTAGDSGVDSSVSEQPDEPRVLSKNGSIETFPPLIGENNLNDQGTLLISLERKSKPESVVQAESDRNPLNLQSEIHILTDNEASLREIVLPKTCVNEIVQDTEGVTLKAVAGRYLADVALERHETSQTFSESFSGKISNILTASRAEERIEAEKTVCDGETACDVQTGSVTSYNDTGVPPFSDRNLTLPGFSQTRKSAATYLKGASNSASSLESFHSSSPIPKIPDLVESLSSHDACKRPSRHVRMNSENFPSISDRIQMFGGGASFRSGRIDSSELNVIGSRDESRVSFRKELTESTEAQGKASLSELYSADPISTSDLLKVQSEKKVSDRSISLLMKEGISSSHESKTGDSALLRCSRIYTDSFNRSLDSSNIEATLSQNLEVSPRSSSTGTCTSSEESCSWRSSEPYDSVSGRSRARCSGSPSSSRCEVTETCPPTPRPSLLERSEEIAGSRQHHEAPQSSNSTGTCTSSEESCSWRSSEPYDSVSGRSLSGCSRSSSSSDRDITTETPDLLDDFIAEENKIHGNLLAFSNEMLVGRSMNDMNLSALLVLLLAQRSSSACPLIDIVVLFLTTHHIYQLEPPASRCANFNLYVCRG